jgi:hypothetical protein
LIVLGCPDDEYDPEVGTILPRLTKAGGPADVETIISEEFLSWFSEKLPEEKVRLVAADVWAAYVRFRDAAPSA